MITDPKLADPLVLVPNQRMHDLHLGRAFELAGERSVLAAPAIEVLSRWVERISSRIDLLHGRPVAAAVNRLWLDQIWQQAVRAQPEWSSAFESRTLAHSARAADRLLRHWLPEQKHSAVVPAFHSWRLAVRETMRNRHQFAPEDWLCHLRSQLEQPADLSLGLPATIHLHGFAELTPLEQSLLKSLQSRGIEVVDLCGRARGESAAAAAAPHSAARVLSRFDSMEEEFRAVANWAVACMGQGARRIGIVVNRLDALAEHLRPVFDRIFHPHDGMRVAFDGDSLYHLADGSRLSEHAVVDDALLVLRMSLKGRDFRHPFPDISRLLLSPHLAGWGDEKGERALFEARLRGQGRYLHSLGDLQALADRRGLAALSRLLTQAGPVRSGTGLSQGLLDRLLEWGWPGPLSEGSLATARVGHFVHLLENLRRLNPGSASEALATLSMWCRDTRVTERGGVLSPVQVISPEDAIGQCFDAAWVLNIHDGNWPSHPLTNPFLRYALLKHIPRATPEGQLHFARKVQGSLDHLAPEVHYSWSRAGDDVPRQASPLLESAASTSGTFLPGPRWPVLSSALAAAPEFPCGYDGHPWLRAVEDIQGLPLQPGRDTRIPGGSGMVKTQSGCPLAAYLMHRLQLRFEPMPGPFADYAYRGRLLHEALYQLFRERVGRPGLPPVSEIAGAVDRALQSCHARFRLAQPALRAERQRLQQLLQQWLEFEGQREGFMVAAVEEEHIMDVHGLALEIRLDRVDQLEDGRRLIVDYKSGNVDPRGWAQIRIVEPQLPLYAVLLDREHAASVGGLALASVRMGACRMAGIVDDPGAAIQTLHSTSNRRTAFGKTFGEWEGLFAHWKSGIDALLQEIVAGHASNRLYQSEALAFSGLETVLRRPEGEAWLLAHGGAGFAPEEDREND